MSVLLTRPEAESREIADELDADGIESLIWPLTRIVRTETAVDLPARVEGLIVTSRHGLMAFAEATPRRDLSVLAVGDHTARTARALGFQAESAPTATALAGLARRSRLGRLFYPRGRDISTDLADLLAPTGIEVIEQILYAAEPTGPPPPPVGRAFERGAIRTVTFWSRRNAKLFKVLWEDQPLGQLDAVTAIAISAPTTEALDGCGFGTMLISDSPNREAMMAAIRGVSAARGRQS